MAATLIMWLLYWNNRRLIRMEHKQKQYRIALFQGISASIGEVLKLESKKGEESTFNATIAFRYHSAAKRLEETERVVNQPVDFSGMRVLLAEDNVHLSFLCILRRTILP